MRRQMKSKLERLENSSIAAVINNRSKVVFGLCVWPDLDLRLFNQYKEKKKSKKKGRTKEKTHKMNCVFLVMNR